MKAFFKGWRRKAGCVTLVIACAFAAGWSAGVTGREDLIAFTLLQRTHCFDSVLGMIHWWSWSSPSGRSDGWYVGRFHVEPTVARRFRYDHQSSQLHYDENGELSFNRDESVLKSRRRIKIPYWLIVVPMTLLSAWLLLSKPRVAKTKTTEPVPATGDAHA